MVRGGERRGGGWGCWSDGVIKGSHSEEVTQRAGGGGMSRAKIQAKSRWCRREPHLLEDWGEGGTAGAESGVAVGRGGLQAVFHVDTPLWAPSKALEHFVQRRGVIGFLCLQDYPGHSGEWTGNWPEWRLGRFSRPEKTLTWLRGSSNGSGFQGSYQDGVKRKWYGMWIAEEGLNY